MKDPVMRDEQPGGDHYRRKLERGLPRIDMYNPVFRRKAQASNKRRAEEAAELLAKARLEADRMLADAKARAEHIVQTALDRAEELVTAASDVPPQPPRVRCMTIIREVALKHGIAVEALLGQSRNRSMVPIRDEAIAAVHHARQDLSLPQLGRVFHRDHTTILHSLRKTGAYLGGERL